MASIKELLSAMISKINGKNEGVDWNENDPESPAFVKNRPFYDTRPAIVELNAFSKMVKVSSEIPEYGDIAHIWLSTGEITDAFVVESGTESLIVFDDSFCVIALTDNAVYYIGDNTSYIFPERGVYFLYAYVDGMASFVSGASFANADAPEITWDGNIPGVLKKLSLKYLPCAVINFDDESETVSTDLSFSEFDKLVRNGASIALRITGLNGKVSTIYADNVVTHTSDPEYTIDFRSFGGDRFSFTFALDGIKLGGPS